MGVSSVQRGGCRSVFMKHSSSSLYYKRTTLLKYRPNTSSHLAKAPPTSSRHRPATSQHHHGNKSPRPPLDLPPDILSAIERLDVTGGSKEIAGSRMDKSHRGQDEGRRGQDEGHRGHGGQERNLEELLPPNIDDMGAGEWNSQPFS